VVYPIPTPKMTAAKYLEWEPRQELRYEYVGEEVVAMTGGTIPQNDIAINLLTLLLPRVRASGCRINMADVKLSLSEGSDYFYPDLMVSCHPQDLQAHKFLQFPKLIVEVLSPGTADRDRTDKFIAYQRISTLQEYLLVSSENIGVECYRRGEGRMWLYYPYTAGDSIDIESVGTTINIEEIYAGVEFDIRQ
jgi:Uma2 family endonuclease